jgi:hypothetical protein
MNTTVPENRRAITTPLAVVVAHAAAVFAVWLLLFVAKWFPRGVPAEVRDWLSRYF